MWIIALLRHGHHLRRGGAWLRRRRVVDEDGTVHGGPVVLHHDGVQGQVRQVPRRASSPWPSFWRSASWAAWCSPTPSAETMNTAFGIPTWVMGLIVVHPGRHRVHRRRVAFGRRDGKDRAHHGRAVRARTALVVLIDANPPRFPDTFAPDLPAAPSRPDAIVGGATLRHHAARHQPGRPARPVLQRGRHGLHARTPTRWPR